MTDPRPATPIDARALREVAARRVVAGVLVVAFAALAPACAASMSADELVAAGDTDFGEGSYAAARAKYGRLLQAYPSHAKAAYVRFRVGRSHFEQRQWLLAIAAFEELIEAHPKAPEVWDALYFGGIAYGKLGQCVDASAWLGKLNEAVALGVPDAQRWADPARAQLDLVNDDMSGEHRFCNARSGAG